MPAEFEMLHKIRFSRAEAVAFLCYFFGTASNTKKRRLIRADGPFYGESATLLSFRSCSKWPESSAAALSSSSCCTLMALKPLI